jgi:hypothetical protein
VSLGTDAKLRTVDDRAIPGRAPIAFWEVTTESTPTARAVLGVLRNMGERYAGQGRVLKLRVLLPASSPGNRVVLDFHWNATDASRVDTGSGQPAQAARSLIVSIGSGDDVIGYPRDTVDLPLGSDVTPEVMAEASGGTGLVFDRVRDTTGLP